MRQEVGSLSLNQPGAMKSTAPATLCTSQPPRSWPRWYLKLSRRRLTYWWLCLGLAWSVVGAAAGVSVEQLRCEYLDNPLGIDTQQPRLSWVLESTQRGQRQTAYQILVASREALLKSDIGDLWDTGMVTSDQTLQVVYAG